MNCVNDNFKVIIFTIMGVKKEHFAEICFFCRIVVTFVKIKLTLLSRIHRYRIIDVLNINLRNQCNFYQRCFCFQGGF